MNTLNVKSLLFRSAIFLRLVDAHDSNLSLTNLAIFLVLYKLYAAPTTSINDIGALLISLASYSYKKYLNSNLDKEQ